jgi:type IV pilus assembly protein PilA
MAKNRKRGFTLIEVIMVLGVIGILSAIAIPNFVGYQGRAKQAEAKANLRAWYVAETSVYQEKGFFTELLSETGFSPMRNNRYQYIFSTACTYEIRATEPPTSTTLDNCVTVDQLAFPTAALTPAAALQPFTYSGSLPDPANPAGIGGSCPLCTIRAVAAGNVDFDSGIDTWVLSTKDGKLNTAGCGNPETNVPAGVPINTFNDAICH